MILPGDLFFTEGSSLVSGAIQFHTHPAIGVEEYDLWAVNRGDPIQQFEPSHVQIIINLDPNRQPGDQSGITVLSADANGVWARDVAQGEWEKYRIMSPIDPFTKEELNDVFLFCRNTSRAPYDKFGLLSFPLNADLQDQHDWFCSEHAYTAYWHGNRHLQKRIKPAL